jgi:uncharacterized protein YpiB (UPF0302 family)
MASENKLRKFAAAILTPQHIKVAEEIVTKHLDVAMTAKDRARVRELSELLNIIDEVHSEAEVEK